MGGLHKQIINSILTIGLHLDKAKNKGPFLAFFFIFRFQARILSKNYQKLLRVPESKVLGIINETFHSFLAIEAFHGPFGIV